MFPGGGGLRDVIFISFCDQFSFSIKEKDIFLFPIFKEKHNSKQIIVVAIVLIWSRCQMIFSVTVSVI